MTQDELINYWRSSSDVDYQAMNHLFQSGDYHWSLFIGHIVIEKMVKALYVKKHGIEANPPKSHDLLLLAERAGLGIDDDMKDMFDLITTFNISARYPDYKQSFYRKCTREYTQDMMQKIKVVRAWLITLLEMRSEK